MADTKTRSRTAAEASLLSLRNFLLTLGEEFRPKSRVVGRAITIMKSAKARIEFLESCLDKTADGILFVDTEEDRKLYCPRCNGEVQQEYGLCYCWNCPNPDSGDEVPLPLSYGLVFASPKATEASSQTPAA